MGDISYPLITEDAGQPLTQSPSCPLKASQPQPLFKTGNRLMDFSNCNVHYIFILARLLHLSILACGKNILTFLSGLLK